MKRVAGWRDPCRMPGPRWGKPVPANGTGRGGKGGDDAAERRRLATFGTLMLDALAGDASAWKKKGATGQVSRREAVIELW